MHTSDFDYELPEELIAQAPLPERTASRLLELDGATERLRDLAFADLPSLLAPGDLLVTNDTRVLPARIRGRKSSGGQVEMLLERLIGQALARVQIRASRAPRIGTVIELSDGCTARVLERTDQLYTVELSGDAQQYFERYGEVPLPPYIERPATQSDRERYQTVMARVPGAVAAPTAGLHFDEAMLDRLTRRGIEHVSVTLHVGLGTFSPLRSDQIESHRLHAERCEIDARVCEHAERAHARGARVVAVGTTVVRALESAARQGRLAPYAGETDLFIYPGFRFRVVDAILTNFHLPRSSLLMLVAAFAGRETTLAAYRHAVSERYRFFSYGDAMFVMPSNSGKRSDAV